MTQRIRLNSFQKRFPCLETHTAFISLFVTLNLAIKNYNNCNICMKIQREETIKTYYRTINVWIESESTDVILPMK